MKFARLIFGAAGIFGLVVIGPMYFLEDRIGSDTPPAITHPEFFYGFVGVVLAWQIAFLCIASIIGIWFAPPFWLLAVGHAAFTYRREASERHADMVATKMAEKMAETLREKKNP